MYRFGVWTLSVYGNPRSCLILLLQCPQLFCISWIKNGLQRVFSKGWKWRKKFSMATRHSTILILLGTIQCFPQKVLLLLSTYQVAVCIKIRNFLILSNILPLLNTFWHLFFFGKWINYVAVNHGILEWIKISLKNNLSGNIIAPKKRALLYLKLFSFGLCPSKVLHVSFVSWTHCK